MGAELLTERYQSQIAGVLSCYDRIIIQGTIPKWCYAKGMTDYFYEHNIRVFDYAKWAEPLRDAIRENMERIAAASGIEIEFVRSKKGFRQEKRVKEVLDKRGDEPGLVCILSAMEPCGSYKPWHDKKTHKTYLKPDEGKCLHYYVYFIDPDLGLCYVRVPTWCPFRLQVYCNGHSYLARQLSQRQIEYRVLDNAFGWIGDFERAQKLADHFSVKMVHRKLDEFADRYCPVVQQFGLSYHWSLDQVEFATDVVFAKQADLQAIYDRLTRAAIHTVKPDNIATFLGRKLNGNYQDEMGNRFNTRMEGTRIRHHMGMVSIKMYDKFGQILRIETTVKDVTFFRHYRAVEQRDGSQVYRYAPMKKTIYSLGAVREATTASNRRYLAFVMQLDDPRASLEKLDRTTRTVSENGRTYRGFNFFDEQDQKLLESIAQGEFCLHGIQNKSLRSLLPERSTQQVSRTIKRLRTHGLVKKTAHSYRYYLTPLGREVIAAGLKLKQFGILNALHEAAA